MNITWRCDVPGCGLVRRLTEPLGVQCWAFSAAKQMGWDGTTRLTYYDSDGWALGGFVPARRQRAA